MAFTTQDGKTRTALAEINMVPFIDIVLVLLIIFMITAPVIQSGIEVDVPVTKTTKELTEQLLVVTIDGKEKLYLQTEAVENVSDLGPLVKSKLASFKNKIYLRAAGNVTWQIVSTVMDSLNQSGIRDIVVVTRPEESRPK